MVAVTARPKDIGTHFTTGVIRHLHANGWPSAELRNQAGEHDRGDIIGTPGVCWECKGGKAAETASDAQIMAWLAETDRERENSRADVGVLVLKRKAVGRANAGRWSAILWSDDAARLMAPDVALFTEAPRVPVRMLLDDTIALLHWAGYGTAVEREHADTYMGALA